jgi:type VI secretion system protein VasG
MSSLLKKLNKTTFRALDSAANLALSKTNYSLEIEHWLLKILDETDSDLRRILRHCEVNIANLERDLSEAIEGFRRGYDRPAPPFSPLIMDLIREAWVLASIQYKEEQVRSGTLLLALLSDAHLSREAKGMSREFAKISVEALWASLPKIVAGSPEEAVGAPAGTGGGETGAVRSGKATKTPALDQYTVNLSERARAGKIDPVLGRDNEIRQMVDILIRRRQNNPILTGEAGVGKTAVVEGFARRIAEGDVPDVLKNVDIRTLDMGLLQAGAGVKGEFENRLKQVIEEVKSSPKPIILFIDEAHTMIGAGGQAGQSDAANLLKPALARGELRTIAATTWAEYKKYFEKDAALARRFQVVKVDEPEEPKAVVMMRGMAGVLESHHKVRILDEAVEASVALSARYITGRQLPDKSLSLLDTACSRVAIGQVATPPALEDCRRRISNLRSEIGILEREGATGARHDERLAERRAELAAAEERMTELEARWQAERALVEEVRSLRAQIERRHAKAASQEAGERAGQEAETERLRSELETKTSELRSLQGESPLMQVCVDSQVVAEVVSGWTGIPAGRMMTDEIRTILNLKSKLEERVIGQSDAIEIISQRIWTARANLTDPRRPIGVFMLVGPSGVGKTETAISLAEALYGGERNLVVINMSEYQEAHTVSGLKGSPPGYVGYGEGGVLTEAVRRKPYSVVLLDEVEKAHPDVMELFFQVFDKGTLEDGEGREIDFKNTVILLTSNAGTDTVMKLTSDPDTAPSITGLAEALRPDLLKIFKPAFLGRLNVVPYYPISDQIMRKIIRLQLDRVARRLRENHKAQMAYSDALIEGIAGRCREVESGARNVDHIITRSLLPQMSREILSRMATGSAIQSVDVGVDDQGEFQFKMSP